MIAFTDMYSETCIEPVLGKNENLCKLYLFHVKIALLH